MCDRLLICIWICWESEAENSALYNVNFLLEILNLSFQNFQNMTNVIKLNVIIPYTLSVFSGAGNLASIQPCYS
jgi:hypothetical protein